MFHVDITYSRWLQGYSATICAPLFPTAFHSNWPFSSPNRYHFYSNKGVHIATHLVTQPGVTIRGNVLKIVLVMGESAPKKLPSLE